jgi:hypothetical protein
VNALATYEPLAPAPRLDAVPFERALTSDDLLAYLRGRLPAAEVPRVVVLDNAGIHTSKAVKAARPGLAKLAFSCTTCPRTARSSTASSRCSSRSSTTRCRPAASRVRRTSARPSKAGSRATDDGFKPNVTKNYGWLLSSQFRSRCMLPTCVGVNRYRGFFSFGFLLCSPRAWG